MKVLFVINSLGCGGAENVVVSLANYLHQKGADVAILILQDDVFIKPNSGVRLYSFQGKRALLRSFLQFISILRNNTYDVINAHMFHSIVFAAIGRIFSCSKAKFVATVHIVREVKELRYFFYKIAFYFYDKKVAVSSDAASAFCERTGGSVVDWKVIPNGVDRSRFFPDLNKKFAKDRSTSFRFFTAGRLADQKDHVTLLDAFSIVLKRYPTVELDIAGDGPLFNVLKDRIEMLAIKDNVHLLGRRNDIPELMRAADFFVLSSKFEGMPLVIGEALASGLPCLSTDCGGLSDYDFDFEWVCPPQNSRALAAIMIKALEESKEALRLWSEKNFAKSEAVDSVRIKNQFEAFFNSLR